MNATIFIFFLFIIIALIFFVFRKYFTRINAAGNITADKNREKRDKDNKTCILCGAIHNKGDKMISDEYKGKDKSLYGKAVMRSISI